MYVSIGLILIVFEFLVCLKKNYMNDCKILINMYYLYLLLELFYF